MEYIPITQWAKRVGVNHTTAIEWAKHGVISAKREQQLVSRWLIQATSELPQTKRKFKVQNKA